MDWIDDCIMQLHHHTMEMEQMKERLLAKMGLK
jgi:hypothetical protein